MLESNLTYLHFAPHLNYSSNKKLHSDYSSLSREALFPTNQHFSICQFNVEVPNTASSFWMALSKIQRTQKIQIHVACNILELEENLAMARGSDTRWMESHCPQIIQHWR